MVLQEFIRIAGEFLWKPDLLPVLAYHRPEIDRLMRSERREAIALVLGFMGYHCDLATRCVGRPPRQDASMIGYSLTEIATDTGLTLSRVERAMDDLVMTGAVINIPRVEKAENGSFFGMPSIRKLSRALFDILGLGAALVKGEKKAKKNLRQKLGHEEAEPAKEDHTKQAGNDRLRAATARNHIKKMQRTLGTASREEATKDPPG